MRPLRAIGLMSGTSLDGVDAALIETDGERVFATGPALSLPYAPELRQAARALLDRAASLGEDDPEVLSVERALTLRHVEAVAALRARIDGPVDVLGFHGQTILHAPAERRTWQIGDASLLSHETGLCVVHDFRSADVAAGGEGAPLAPWYHAALLRDVPGDLAVLNLGGVGNVTWRGADGVILACDTGPGNALLDDWALRHTGLPYDRDGALARAGRPREDIVQAVLRDPFFDRPAPKSLDRLSFAKAMALVEGLSPEEGAATLAALTIACVARAPLPRKPARWLVCGGGRHNPVLMDGLRHTLGNVVAVEALGWDGDALEAQCFGFLAVRSLRGFALSAPGMTGGPDGLVGGRLSCAGIVPPEWMG